MQQEEQVCRPHWEESEDMPEEMGKLCEEGFQKTAWKGMKLITVYAPIFCHPKYSSFATKGCESALIDDEK